MNSRFVAGVTAGAVLALSLTACNDDPKSKAGSGEGGVGGAAGNLSAIQVLEKTSQKTGKTDTLKADMNVQTTAPGQGQVQMHMAMQMRLRPQVQFDMVMDRMTVNGQASSLGNMRIVLVDKTMYMKSPALAGGGKAWVKLSLSDLGKRSGQNLDQLLQQQRQVDPAEQTKMFTGSKNIRAVGKEQVEGVETTHFVGSLTPEEALSKLSPAERGSKEKALQKVGATKLDFELWVDGQQLPRKMIVKTDGKVPTTSTIVYRDYGKPVSITAPPASQVGPMPGALSPRT